MATLDELAPASWGKWNNREEALTEVDIVTTEPQVCRRLVALAA